MKKGNKMNLVKKTIELSVTIMVEIDEDLGMDDPYDLGDNICEEIYFSLKNNDIIDDEKIIGYSAQVVGIK
jgi:hypothetical protein